MHLIKRIFHDSFLKQTLGVFLIKIISSILGFTTTVLLVKKLGGEESSSYFFLIALVSVCTAITTFGSPDAILKFSAINRGVGKLVRLVIRKTCMFAFSASILAAAVIYFVNNIELLSSEKLFVLTVFIILPLASVNLVLSAALQGIGRVVYAMVASGVLQSACVLSAIFLFELDYLGVVLALAFGYFLSSIFSIYFLKIDLNNKDKKHNLSGFKSTCKSMFVSQCVIQFNNHSAILLLGLLWVGTDISVMAIAMKLTTLISFIIIAVNRVLAPQIASKYEKADIADLQLIITKSARFMWLFCLPAILLIIVFSKELLILIDQAYAEYSKVLIMLAIGQVVNVLTGNVGLLLSMTGHEKVQKNILIVSLLVSLAMGFMLVPEYGPFGASIMMTRNIALVNLSSYFYVLTKLKLNTMKLL